MSSSKIIQLKNLASKAYVLSTSVIAINIASKLLGFVREVVISSTFGASPVVSIYFVVQQLPLLISNFLMGAFNMSFVAQYSKFNSHASREAWLLKLALKIFVYVSLISIIMLFLAYSSIRIWNFGNFYEYGYQAVRILAFSIVPTAAIAMAYNILHAERKHKQGMFLAAFAPAMMLIWLIVLTFFSNSNSLALPYSYLLGSISGALVSLKMVSDLNIFSRAVLKIRSVHFRKDTIGSSFFKQTFASGIENVGFNINQALSLYIIGKIDPSGAAFYAFTSRIAFLPLSGILSPLYQIFQGELSNYNKRQSYEYFLRYSKKVLLIIVAMMTFLIIFKTEIVTLIYERGSFTSQDTTSVAQLLIPFSLYFAIMGLNQFIARFFFYLSIGATYSLVMTIGYISANIFKILAMHTNEISNVVYASVIGEGGATIVLCAVLFILRRTVNDTK